MNPTTERYTELTPEKLEELINDKDLKPTPQTIARSLALAVALINQGLSVYGLSPLPFDDHGVYLFVSMVFAYIITIRSWWKNNSITRGAIIGDILSKFLKRGK